MKKKILIILGILIVVCLAVCGIIFYNKSLEYTVEETKELVKKGSNLPEEIYLKTWELDNETFEEKDKLTKEQAKFNEEIKELELEHTR